jgi:hypothetical protein
MLPLGLFRRPAFTGIQLAAFGLSGSMFALFLYLTLYLQGYLGHSALEAGVRYLPLTVATFLIAPVAASLLSRLQARYMLSAGLVLVGVALLLMGSLDASSDFSSLLVGFIVAGIGVGLLNPVIADVAVSVVPKEQSGMASGINDTFRQVGVAVGIAAWGAIFLGRGSGKVEELAAGTPAADGERPRELVEAVSSGNLDAALAGVPADARETVATAAREGFLAGMNDIVTIGAALAFVGAVFALWLVRERDIEREQPAEVTELERAEAVPEAAAA